MSGLTQDEIKMTFDTTFIPVNANNDNGTTMPNGSKWSAPGIPYRRDFGYEQEMAASDPELKRMVFTATRYILNDQGEAIAAAAIPGNLTVYPIQSSLESHGGYLSLWDNARKHQAFSGAHVGGDGTEIYIEGVHESLDPGDVGVEVIFTPDQGGGQWSNIYNLTVTPVINSFTATIPAGQTINWTYWAPETTPPTPTSWQGLSSGKLTGESAIRFDADAEADNVALRFVMNLTAVTNGINHDGFGWEYVTGQVRNRLPMNGLTFPCLDALTDDPTDQSYVDPNPPSGPNATSIAAVDSPNTACPLDNSTPPVILLMHETSVIDVRYAFSQYLVASYPDGSIYAVAQLDWTCNFWADTNDPTRPPAGLGRGATNIRDPNGVRAPDGYFRTNADPNTRPPICNFNMHWQ